MVSHTEIEVALSLSLPVIDVRSPGEFEKGHIPGAVNIPLFSDEERARVGTVYKQQSPEKAKELGYSFVLPKLEFFIEESLKVAPDKEVIVHCWRGGQRSQAFAQHLSENGFGSVKVIEGGYKSFRRHVLETFEKPYNLIVLGGFTGSGKTHILYELHRTGHQIIDLEGLANHKGSAFGGIDQPHQPTTEQFENDLFIEWQKLDAEKPIWIEDESLDIGRVKIPYPLYQQMRDAIVYFIDIPQKERAKILVEDYADCDNAELEAAIHRISKRLGGLNERIAIEELHKGNYFEVAMIALGYYDKGYLKGLNKREKDRVVTIPLETTDHRNNAKKLTEIIPL